MFQIIASKYFLNMDGLTPFISDNGSCYTLQAFTSFMQSYSVYHITSSLQYPQSNALAQKYVQIVKNLFYKSKEEGKDFFKCLMIYHITPLTGSMQPPMHRFFKAGMQI